MHGSRALARLSIVITAAALLFAACSSTGSSSAPSSAASAGASTAAGDPNDLLAKIKAAGTIRVGTDPAYPPQSEVKPDGSFEGLTSTANEAAKRLGRCSIRLTSRRGGGRAGRFDISVGSVTITEARKAVLDFTEPYY
jgi:polar amino acid transport system substrate-binding protein